MGSIDEGLWGVMESHGQGVIGGCGGVLFGDYGGCGRVMGSTVEE